MSETVFRFKKFSVSNIRSAQKVGTDGVLLGAASLLPAASDGPLRVLDIGTGTGVVALILAQRIEEAGLQADIKAIDIDRNAALEAEENFAASPWSRSLTAIHTSLQDFADNIRPCEGCLVPGQSHNSSCGEDGTLLFDLVASNPPYYDASLPAPDRERNTARHTESLSYREVITFAGDCLAEKGYLSLILPKEEEIRLIRFAASFGLYPFRILNIRTASSKPVRRIVATFCRERGTVTRKELVILDDGTYTQAYREFTGPYYVIF